MTGMGRSQDWQRNSSTRYSLMVLPFRKLLLDEPEKANHGGEDGDGTDDFQ